MAEHTYLVPVGSVRGDSPQDVREHAIDWAVNDIPEAGGRYEVAPGYEMALWNQDRHQGARGAGRFVGLCLTVRVTVPGSQACWTAPGSEPSTGRTQERRATARLNKTREDPS